MCVLAVVFLLPVAFVWNILENKFRFDARFASQYKQFPT